MFKKGLMELDVNRVELAGEGPVLVTRLDAKISVDLIQVSVTGIGAKDVKKHLAFSSLIVVGIRWGNNQVDFICGRTASRKKLQGFG